MTQRDSLQLEWMLEYGTEILKNYSIGTMGVRPSTAILSLHTCARMMHYLLIQSMAKGNNAHKKEVKKPKQNKNKKK